MAQVKRLARESGRTMTKVIEDALRVAVARAERPPARTVTIVTFNGDGVQPGVNLDDSAALLDRMDGIE
jgi:hypothetical protein